MRALFPLKVMTLSLMLCCGCCLSIGVPTALAQPAPRAGKCYVLSIQGMTCEDCATHLQKGLSAVPGVAEAKVHFRKAEASVCTKPGADVTPEALVKAVEKAGYKAKVKMQ